MNKVYLALNICTYKREEYLLGNIALLKNSLFFTDKDSRYFNKLDIFITDNASELELETDEHIHLFHNPNTGGSGGFQRGIEEIRKSLKPFTNVIFMDDDVKFELSTFYILFDYLSEVSIENADRPVAGRMFDLDKPNIQWTAAEKWNSGYIKHVEFLRDISDSDNPYVPGKVIYDADADYGGFWFCCYPYSFVKEKDILPFFLHCDDVEYGLRCGKKPVIIEGVHVWHETWDKKVSLAIIYFDTRNPLFVNQLYGNQRDLDNLIETGKMKVKQYISEGKYSYANAVIDGIRDYNKGFEWLKLNGFRGYSSKYKNTVFYKFLAIIRLISIKHKLSSER